MGCCCRHKGVLEFRDGVHVLLSPEVRGTFEFSHEVVECFDDGISRSDCGLRDVFVLEVHGVGKAMGPRGFYEDAMCSVMFRGGTNVPTVSGMFAPAAPVTGFYVELYRTANRCKWHSVVVKRPMVIGISRDLWCNIGILQEVQSQDSLWEQAVPFLDGEGVIHTREN